MFDGDSLLSIFHQVCENGPDGVTYSPPHCEDAEDFRVAFAFGVLFVLVLIFLILYFLTFVWKSVKIDQWDDSEKLSDWVVRPAMLKPNLLIAIQFFAYLIPSCFLLAGVQHYEEEEFRIFLLVIMALIAVVVSIIFCFFTLLYEKALDHEYFLSQKTIEARNVYQNFTFPIVRTILVGLTQLILLSMFIWGLVRNGRPDFSDPIIYTYYWLGSFIQVAYLIYKDPLNFTLDQNQNIVTFWANVFHNDSRNGSFFAKGDLTLDVRPVTLRIRFCLTLLINTSGLFIVMLGLPILVAGTSDPLEFVLNVIAANYITEMDDREEVLEINILPMVENVEYDYEGFDTFAKDPRNSKLSVIDEEELDYWD